MIKFSEGKMNMFLKQSKDTVFRGWIDRIIGDITCKRIPGIHALQRIVCAVRHLWRLTVSNKKEHSGRFLRLPRIQSVEVEDCPWLPGFIRQGMIEALGLIFRTLRIYQPAWHVLREWVEDSEGVVLDMASGSGYHIADYSAWSCERNMSIPQIRVSDLYPDYERLQALERQFPGSIQAVTQPVDAASVPDSLCGGVRTIFGAFHHFPPETAVRVLTDAVQNADGILIFEPHPRRIRNLFCNIFGIFFGIAAPFVSGRFTWKRLIFSTLIPVIPVLLVWDGIISVFRAYTREEMETMIASLPENDFKWRIINISGPGIGRFLPIQCVMGSAPQQKS